MAPAPQVVDAVTGTGDHAAAPGTRAPAPEPHRPAKVGREIVECIRDFERGSGKHGGR